MSYSENEDDPPVYESSGDEWDEAVERKRNKRRTSQRLSKKPRLKHVETSDSEDDDDDEDDDDEDDEVITTKKPMNGVNKNTKKTSPKAPTVTQRATSPVAKSAPATTNHLIPSNFNTGTFVILKKDAQKCSEANPPSIWKIDGKALLQKYEPFEEDGKIKHRNTSVYTGWSSSDREEYASIQVQVYVHSGQKMVVEMNWDQLKTIEIDSD